MSYGELG
jgi:hypothetical protein